MDTYDVIELPAGTLVHVEGLPFALAKATEVHGREANLSLTSAKGTVTARGLAWAELERDILDVTDSEGVGGVGAR